MKKKNQQEKGRGISVFCVCLCGLSGFVVSCAAVGRLRSASLKKTTTSVAGETKRGEKIHKEKVAATYFHWKTGQQSGMQTFFL